MKNISRYSLMVAVAVVLASASPALAAKKNTESAHKKSILQTLEATLLTHVALAKADDSMQVAQNSTTTDTSTDAASTSTPVTATTSIDTITPLPPVQTTVKPAKKPEAATTTAAIATSGIASLFLGSSNDGNAYSSGRFSATQTQNLLLLAIAFAVLGFILTGDKQLRRFFVGITSQLKVEPQPQASSSRA